jgi:hypothetical protein
VVVGCQQGFYKKMGGMVGVGGKARAEALTAEQRAEIAKKAAEHRWAQLASLRKVICGAPERPLRIGALEIPCYVLEGEVRVLSQRGMQTGIGMSTSGGSAGAHRLAQFIESLAEKGIDCEDLAVRIRNPIQFRAQGAGKAVYGYEATILADVCDAVLAARKVGVLLTSQKHIADQCELLVRTFARVGIIALVDEATGYQEIRDKHALAKILERYLLNEARKWDKMFQIDYYKELFRLQGWTFDPSTNARTPYLGKLTNNIIYERLQPGVLKKLDELNPRIHRADGKSRRKYTHHQFFTGDVGVPELKEHLSNVTVLMKVSKDWENFLEMLDKVKPRVGDTLKLDLDFSGKK